MQLNERLLKYYLLIRNLPFFLFKKKPKILSFKDTIDEIINNKKSFARFGDGEIRMMLDKNEAIGFQKSNSNLTKRLQEILQSTFSTNNSLLIGLPNTFKLLPKNTLHSQVFWYGFNIIYAKKFLCKVSLKYKYGDTNITRFYMMYKYKSEKNVLQKIKKLQTIWDNEDIVFVEGESTKLGVANDLFSNVKSIQRIICPSENAFEKYDVILEKTKELGKNKLIIIALGPTATVLASDLSKEGLWALDLGHIDIEYMWFLEKATFKSPVKGKYVNEANISLDNELEKSQAYFNEIIVKIK